MKPKLSDLCRYKIKGINLIVLMIGWSTLMYSYYILESFYAYTLGSIFVDTIVSANAEALGYLLSGFIY